MLRQMGPAEAYRNLRTRLTDDEDGGQYRFLADMVAAFSTHPNIVRLVRWVSQQEGIPRDPPAWWQ